LFRTGDVIAARGYLTSSEQHLKDTVAEDMELVVRLTRRLRENGQPGVIRYAPGANCWTEVPESIGILAAQRDRWQRGLVDVLFFHRAITLRRRYGRAGMLAMPYHYIFELVGPWLEAQALILLVVGLATGVLPLTVAGAVFIATIGLGMITSFLAVRLAEWRRPLFRRFDRFLLLFFSLLENFGYRQLASLLRLRGSVSILRQRTGWGTMRRKGFSQEGTKR
jgi:cellulose synthase/poly-beta-1,6-N-acetylglucosamine synthase-like glycosyltransferase